MSNSVNFDNAELSSFTLATAKNGNQYISGFLVDSTVEGGYTTSKAFRSFDAAVIAALPVELVELAGKGRATFPKGSRPRISVSGWLQNKADAKGIWQETLMGTTIK